jgi:hypothetical protein
VTPRDPRRLAPLLWVLPGLFALRVAGQALVAAGAAPWLPVFGWLYLGAMIVRYPVQMALNPEDRWLDRT